MALVVKDRVKETTTTTGVGTYTLGGAVTGFETFTSNLSNADTTYYVCTDGTDFEVGIGTFTSSGTTLARTTILASSNSNNAVSWSSGTREIFITYPADKSVFKDASNNINGTFVGNITGNVTGNADTATVATTVTITDNENTSEDNAVVFTAGGDVDGGNLGLESDGDLTYNPSTGRLTATQLAGTLQTAAQANITSVGTLSSLTTSGDITVGDDLTVEGGQIDLRTNSGAVGKMKFYCEVSNAHAQTLQAQPHSAASSAVLVLPTASGTLLGSGDAVSVKNSYLLNTDIKIGEDDETKIDFETADEIHFYAANVEQVYLADNIFGPQSDSDVDLGTTGVRWKDAYLDSVTVTDNVTIGGNLTVNGTTTTIDTTNTVVKDSLLGLNNGASSNSNDSGIIIERGSTGNDALLIWDESADKWALGTTTDNASSTGNLNMTTGTLVANIEGNVTGDVTGNVTGAVTGITSLTNSSLVIGRDADNDIDFGHADNEIRFRAGGQDQLRILDGSIRPVTNNDVDLGSSAKKFKDAHFDGTVNSDAFVGPLTGDVTGNADTASAVAADNISTGDAAVTIATSSGNITLDAQGSDTDIKFKGTDGSSDITALTLDMSNGGSAVFSNNINLSSDSSILKFGSDNEITLTHVHDTGLKLNSTSQLQFGDSGTYIHQSADGVLDLVSDTEIEINATTIDMNGNLDVSGTITSGGVITGTGFTIGSAAITEAELEILDGATVSTTELNYVDGVTSAIQTQIDAKASKGFATAMAIAL